LFLIPLGRNKTLSLNIKIESILKGIAMDSLDYEEEQLEVLKRIEITAEKSRIELTLIRIISSVVLIFGFAPIMFLMYLDKL
jgi:hypothetical protein